MAASNNYVVGKGRLFFNKFLKGTKQPSEMRYFGNTPMLDVTRTATALDHYSSEGGVKVKDDSLDIETGVNGKFQTDNISSANMALWFGGNTFVSTRIASPAAITETFPVLLDGFYAMGVTPETPMGLSQISTPILTAGGTPLVEGTDYILDQASGMFHILPGSTVAPNAPVTFSYHTDAAEQELVVEAGETLYGQLKFVADNPKGRNRDYFYPYVKLSAGATFALKGDTWQMCEFNYEALKLDDSTQRVYITAR